MKENTKEEPVIFNNDPERVQIIAGLLGDLIDSGVRVGGEPGDEPRRGFGESMLADLERRDDLTAKQVRFVKKLGEISGLRQVMPEEKYLIFRSGPGAYEPSVTTERPAGMFEAIVQKEREVDEDVLALARINTIWDTKAFGKVVKRKILIASLHATLIGDVDAFVDLCLQKGILFEIKRKGTIYYQREPAEEISPKRDAAESEVPDEEEELIRQEELSRLITLIEKIEDPNKGVTRPKALEMLGYDNSTEGWERLKLLISYANARIPGLIVSIRKKDASKTRITSSGEARKIVAENPRKALIRLLGA
jgi:hypothetical protein